VNRDPIEEDGWKWMILAASSLLDDDEGAAQPTGLPIETPFSPLADALYERIAAGPEPTPLVLVGNNPIDNPDVLGLFKGRTKGGTCKNGPRASPPDSGCPCTDSCTNLECEVEKKQFGKNPILKGRCFTAGIPLMAVDSMRYACGCLTLEPVGCKRTKKGFRAILRAHFVVNTGEYVTSEVVTPGVNHVTYGPMAGKKFLSKTLHDDDECKQVKTGTNYDEFLDWGLLP
jgi:hypothetical protein